MNPQSTKSETKQPPSHDLHGETWAYGLLFLFVYVLPCLIYTLTKRRGIISIEGRVPDNLPAAEKPDAN